MLCTVTSYRNIKVTHMSDDRHTRRDKLGLAELEAGCIRKVLMSIARFGG